MRVSIPGLPEAFEKERRLREEVYLGSPYFVCGIPLNQITPRIFARLLFIRTPFIGDGDVTPAAIGAFLWACHRDYEKPRTGWFGRTVNRKRDRFLRSLKRMDFEELEDGIDAFLDATFLDMPSGGKTTDTPYVCGVAWMNYRMMIDPFRLTREVIADIPLREMYQLIRCHDSVNGTPLFNKYSDRIKDDYLRELNADTEALNELSGGLN